VLAVGWERFAEGVGQDQFFQALAAGKLERAWGGSARAAQPGAGADPGCRALPSRVSLPAGLHHGRTTPSCLRKSIHV